MKSGRPRQKTRRQVGEPTGDSRLRFVGALDAVGSASFYAVLGGIFLATCLYIYGPALSGMFLSDDEHYVLNNDYIHEFNLRNITAILDPAGDPAKVVENYAPVHLLLHAIQWQFFGIRPFGYHVFNVSVHALAGLLLVAFFRRFGLSRLVAALLGGLFVVHPANVEAVAWISQLKTPAAMVLCLAALLVQPRRPVWGSLLFGLALFAKPTAAVALFALALMTWFQVQRNSRGVEDPSTESEPGQGWKWVLVWGVIFGFFAIAEFSAFNKTAGQAPVMYADLGERLRTTCAISLRYMVMTLSGHGMSTFHEPPPARSFFDPWFLGSIAMLSLLGWRTLAGIAKQRDEAIFWVWAVVSFAPICGVIPLPYPMADRYLYFILPGLIGGAWLALSTALTPRLDAHRLGRPVALAAVAVALVFMLFFAQRGHARAYVWQSANAMMADAELHYPEGLPAQTRIAHRRAVEGDAEGTVAALRRANARGYNRVDHLISDPGYDRVRNHPLFRELIRDIAQDWLDRFLSIEDPSELDLRLIAQAHIILDDLAAAIKAVEEAVALDGILRPELEIDLENLKRKKRIRDSVRQP